MCTQHLHNISDIYIGNNEHKNIKTNQFTDPDPNSLPTSHISQHMKSNILSKTRF